MSGRHLQHRITAFIESFFAAGLCLACACELSADESLCAHCRQLLRKVPNPCSCCGQPNPANHRVCPACLLNPPRWQKLIAPFQYQTLVRDYLHQLKYSQATYLGKCLCRYGFESLRLSTPKPEVLLPVPLHRQRLLERGFNQAEEIAACWGRELGVSVDRKALRRSRNTPVQSGLSAAQRERNLIGAFTYSSKASYRHVAIVDDIVTTGSTVQEITRLLHRAGVDYVEVWALARVYRS